MTAEGRDLVASAVRDRFGNPLDAWVGYARGSILRHSGDELARNAQGRRVLRDRVLSLGPDSVFHFNGSRCGFPLKPVDLLMAVQEPVGPSVFGPRLRELALAHMGGHAGDQVAVLNRTSAGIIAAELALLSKGDTVLSLVPGGLSHPSIRRGASLAGAHLVELTDLAELQKAVEDTAGPLVIITGVTSELIVMPEHDFIEAIQVAKASGRVCLVDDAYGARVRTELFQQPAARKAGADLAITSTQKAGLSGPRAGLLIGRPSLVDAVVCRAAEMGQEGRAPMALGVLRALEGYGPECLQRVVAVGQEMHVALADRFGRDRVIHTALGPAIKEDDVLAVAREGRGGNTSMPLVVPAEASAALGMLLLEHHGMLTGNVLASPGARVSLRLKSTEEEVDRMGGTQTLLRALEDGFDRLSAVIEDGAAMRRLILGDG